MSDRIEYLADLGVTCLWLMPFYPTARKDDGYDIVDFFGVDPRLGTLGDFVELVRTARSRGIRVIVDFVMNHTSDAHPWFKSARRSVDDPYRDYYVWRATEPRASRRTSCSPTRRTASGSSTRRPTSGTSTTSTRHQPDLNIANPEVQEEISRTLGSGWSSASRGSGSTPCPSCSPRTPYPGEPGGFDPDEYLGDVRNFVTRRVGDAVLLGEVNVAYKDQKKFFGGPDGDGLNMQFDFIGMQNVYLSLARGDARPLAEAMRRRPTLDVTSQWANFVRNHDELTLDKLTDDRAAGGLRRVRPRPGHAALRAGPPATAADHARWRRAPHAARLLTGLLAAGHPVLFYGEEIGMGENLDIPGPARRAHPDAVDDGPNGGFSTAPKRRLTRPCRRASGRGPRQRRRPAPRPRLPLVLHPHLDPHLPAAAADRLVDVEVLDHDTPSVLAHVARCDDWRLLALHNLGRRGAQWRSGLGQVPEGSSARDVLDGAPDVGLPTVRSRHPAGQQQPRSLAGMLTAGEQA